MAKLGDICTNQSSNIKQGDLETLNGEYPIYGASGFIKNIDFYKQDKPYVAIVKDGAGIGRVMQLPAFSSIIGTMQYIIPNDDTDVKYLAYAMEHMNLSKYFTGATIPHIYFKDYKNESIIAHDFETQRQIAANLDKVTHTIDLCNAILEKLDLLVKSRFVEMFGGIHDSKLYQYKSVNKFSDVVSGGTPSRDIPEYWNNGNIPWVKTTELQNCVIEQTEEYITEKGLSESSAKIVPPNTVLIAMYGQGKTRGMTGILSISASTNQACACILPSSEINPIYLWTYFILSYDDLRSLAKGGNQPNLNGNMIKNYPVLFPPLALQEQFAAFVEQTDKSKLAVKQVLEKAETLKKALMQEYFG